MTRNEVITGFLARHGFGRSVAEPLAQDASFRRYLRLRGGPRPAVLMDAPAPEDVRPFLRVGAHLASAGLSVPEIIAADPAQGLVLEEDLGDGLLSVLLSPATIAPLIGAAVETLVAMQRAPVPDGLPAWDARAMTEATLGSLFDWWWPAVFTHPAPAAARDDVAAGLTEMLSSATAGPHGFVHRDFFAGNLLWLPERSGVRRVGIIDFQGAATGHPAYDLVSLVQDARRDIPPDVAQQAVTLYLSARPELDPAAFRGAFAACAAQRHLRVAVQWVRLARRDGRPQYLVHGPRTWRLLDEALQDPAVAPLTEALDRWIPRTVRANPPDLAA